MTSLSITQNQLKLLSASPCAYESNFSNCISITTGLKSCSFISPFHSTGIQRNNPLANTCCVFFSNTLGCHGMLLIASSNAVGTIQLSSASDSIGVSVNRMEYVLPPTGLCSLNLISPLPLTGTSLIPPALLSLIFVIALGYLCSKSFGNLNTCIHFWSCRCGTYLKSSFI